MTGKFEAAMRATVVVDVSSLAHRVGALDGRVRRAEVRLASLVKVLEGRGYAVDRLMVAAATVPVISGHDSKIDNAEAITAANRAWIAAEAEALPAAVEMTVLDGGHDGAREIGVDDLVVAAAMIEAHRIAQDGDIADRVVLIVTHDGDMDHVAAYAAPVTVRMVGSYDRTTRRRLRRAGVPFDALHDYELRNCAMTTPWVIMVPDDDDSRCYGGAPQPVETLPETTHTAVIDVYGLACSAACALGISRLPNIGSLRNLLKSFGYPADTALLVTIPDIARVEPSDDELIHARNLAWYARDQELDALTEELQLDGDDTTQVRRGLLRVDRLPADIRRRLDRSGPTRAAKRVATQLTADMVRVALRDTGNEVIVITDSPHVVWVQAYLSQVGVGAATSRVVRLGVYAAPVTLVDKVRDQRLLPVEFRMLTEDRIAQTTRTHGHVGRELRRRMHDTLGSPESESIEWKVVSFDPEIDGLRVRRVDEPAFDMLLADALTLGVKPGQKITLSELDVELHFQPGMPALVPVPTCLNSGRDGSVRSYSDVVVVEREGTHLHFDLDGDEVPDGSVTLGHDMRPFQQGASAVLGKLHKSHDEWYFVSTPDDTPAGRPELIEVISVDGPFPTARSQHCDHARCGPLYPPPNSPPVPVGVADHLWAINTTPTSDTPNWITLSTPLHGGAACAGGRPGMGNALNRADETVHVLVDHFNERVLPTIPDPDDPREVRTVLKAGTVTALSGAFPLATM